MDGNGDVQLYFSGKDVKIFQVKMKIRGKFPSGKLTFQWNNTIFNRKYIFNPGPFSIARLVYRSVKQKQF